MGEMQQAGGNAADSSRLRQTRKQPNLTSVAPWRCRDALFNRALAHWAQWGKADHPGLHRMVLDMFGRPTMTWQAVQGWLYGRAPSPVWAERALAAVIKAESIYGLQLAAELEASADRKEAASSTGKRVAQGFHRWK